MRLLAACTLLAAGANRANAVPTSVRDESRTAVPSSNDLDDDAFTARDGCVTLLESVCRDHRSDVFHCAECAGGHAVELQTAGCSNDAISLWCAGQAPSPAALSRCFIEPAWTREQIVQQKAVPFGQSFNNQTGKMQTLLLDTYEPPASDTRRQRPAFVLIHGGAFIYGNRTSDGEPDVAYALATRGYFVISIEYRLTGYYWGADAQCYWGSTSWAAPCPGTDQTATDAMEDGKAAIRFLRAKASEWRIDPTRIGVAGDSAGAITSNWIGYVPEGEGHSGNPGYSSAVSVVVPISGSLRFDFWCQKILNGKPIGCEADHIPTPAWEHVQDMNNARTQPPWLGIHGDMDLIVPYRNAVTIKAQADKIGLLNELITIKGAGHVPIAELVDPSKPYLEQFTTFIVRAMNLTDARDECPH